MTHRNRAAPQQRVALYALTTYLCVVAVIVFSLRPIDTMLAPLLAWIARYVPFLTTFERIEFASNVALFLPIGALLSLGMRRQYLVLPVAFLSSVSIEAVQSVFLPNRTPSLLDVLANTAGATLGIVIAAGATALMGRRTRHRQYADGVTDRRIKLPYLDGVRGYAALAVVVYHTLLYTGMTGESHAAFPLWAAFVSLGYLGVPVFIVLSGYVLMLPVAATPGKTFRHGVGNFLYRRSRRILPPYFAALLFALLLIWAVPLLQTPAGTQWDTKLPVTPWGVISHLLLIHDFSPTEYGTINGPLWSVALEFQIYFVMALVLLPLARRIGTPSTFLITLAFGVLMAATGWGDWAHPWLLALFAAGMWAAELTLAPRLARWVTPSAAASAIAFVAIVPAAAILDFDRVPWTEITVGLAVAGGLVILSRREIEGRDSWLTRLLRHRFSLFLGLISYSVYLFHSPILGLGNLLLLPLGLPLIVQYLIMMVVVAPIAVTIAWGMFMLVERHFLNSRQRQARQEIEDHTTIPLAETSA